MLKSAQRLPLARAKHVAGVTLLESLVSIVVLALGVLGLLGAQLRTMVDSRSATSATVAARLADELFERVKVNPNANIAAIPTNDPLNVAQWGWLAGYTAAWGTVPAIVTNCDNAFCNTADKATWDMNRWTQSVAATLPGGLASAQRSLDNPRQLIVIIGWNANENNSRQIQLVLPASVNIPAQCPTPINPNTTHNCYVAYGQP